MPIHTRVEGAQRKQRQTDKTDSNDNEYRPLWTGQLFKQQGYGIQKTVSRHDYSDQTDTFIKKHKLQMTPKQTSHRNDAIT